jgi:hypothetical protein
MADRPTVSLADLQKLQEQEDRPDPLTEDQLADYAAAMLMVLRGLPRREKMKVVTRLRRMMR